MKNTLALLALFACVFPALSQKQLNIGAGITLSPGVVVEFEKEKQFTENFSLPLRANLGFFMRDDYNALTVDIHKGFRQYFNSGLFTEQWLGIGGIASFYKVEGIWYYDDFGNVIAFREGANWGIMPSVTLGAGYNLSNDKETKKMIWVRPKIYWNLGFRSFNLPYASLQVGYTFTIK